VLAVGATGAAYAAGAAIQGRQPVMIYACQDKATGVLRMVQPAEACKRSENRVQWDGRSATGPRGPQGPRGEIGPTGPASVPAAVKATWWTVPMNRWNPLISRDNYLIGAAPAALSVGHWAFNGYALIQWASDPDPLARAAFGCSVVVNGDALLSGRLMTGTLAASDTQGVMIPISGTLTVLDYAQPLELFCWNSESTGANLQVKDGSLVAIPVLSINGS
jgi:hypothetical protein